MTPFNVQLFARDGVEEDERRKTRKEKKENKKEKIKK